MDWRRHFSVELGHGKKQASFRGLLIDLHTAELKVGEIMAREYMAGRTRREVELAVLRKTDLA